MFFSIMVLNCKAQRKTGSILFDINHSKIPFDPPLRVMEIKTKINKWDLMKFKSFCTAKETINKVKRQRMGESPQNGRK